MQCLELQSVCVNKDRKKRMNSRIKCNDRLLTRYVGTEAKQEILMQGATADTKLGNLSFWICIMQIYSLRFPTEQGYRDEDQCRCRLVNEVHLVLF